MQVRSLILYNFLIFKKNTHSLFTENYSNKYRQYCGVVLREDLEREDLNFLPSCPSKRLLDHGKSINGGACNIEVQSINIGALWFCWKIRALPLMRPLI